MHAAPLLLDTRKDETADTLCCVLVGSGYWDPDLASAGNLVKYCNSAADPLLYQFNQELVAPLGHRCAQGCCCGCCTRRAGRARCRRLAWIPRACRRTCAGSWWASSGTAHKREAQPLCFLDCKVPPQPHRADCWSMRMRNLSQAGFCMSRLQLFDTYPPSPGDMAGVAQIVCD